MLKNTTAIEARGWMRGRRGSSTQLYARVRLYHLHNVCDGDGFLSCHYTLPHIIYIVKHKIYYDCEGCSKGCECVVSEMVKMGGGRIWVPHRQDTEDNWCYSKDDEDKSSHGV
jgi:hypothetical protein